MSLEWWITPHENTRSKLASVERQLLGVRLPHVCLEAERGEPASRRLDGPVGQVDPGDVRAGLREHLRRDPAADPDVEHVLAARASRSRRRARRAFRSRRRSGACTAGGRCDGRSRGRTPASPRRTGSGRRRRTTSGSGSTSRGPALASSRPLTLEELSRPELHAERAPELEAGASSPRAVAREAPAARRRRRRSPARGTRARRRRPTRARRGRSAATPPRA